MKWTVCPVGPLQANCYVIEREDTAEALIIDPGDEIEKIADIVREKGLHPLAILLTHAHFDHIGALDRARELWEIPAYLHEREADWTNRPDKNGSTAFTMVDEIRVRAAEKLLNKEQKLDIGPFSCRVLETPGHSPGGVSYYFPMDKVVFCGDALFSGSIGRSDGFQGDGHLLIQSIQTRLMTLPAETTVLPGHGPATTIAREEESNPFLN